MRRTGFDFMATLKIKTSKIYITSSVLQDLFGVVNPAVCTVRVNRSGLEINTKHLIRFDCPNDNSLQNINRHYGSSHSGMNLLGSGAQTLSQHHLLQFIDLCRCGHKGSLH